MRKKDGKDRVRVIYREGNKKEKGVKMEDTEKAECNT